MKKTILIIGGGEWQLPIVKKVKQMGHLVVNTNLYENSIAFKYADFSYVIDVLDREKNLEIAMKHSVDAVITDQSDIAVQTVAYINEKLNLNGIGIDSATLFTNKYRMREELKVDNLYHPKYKLCSSIQDVEQLFLQSSGSIIIKPTSNQSSRGIKKISQVDEIKSAYEYTKKYCRDSYILAEEFIGGIEVTLEGFKFPQAEHQTFGISKKTHFDGAIGIASSLLYLPKHKEFDTHKIAAINNTLFCGVAFGITHVEYKIFNSKIYLIEAAIRGGGSKISSHIVPAISGFDINELLIKASLSQTISYEDKGYKQKCALLKFFDFGYGEVKKIVYDIEGYQEYLIDFKLEFKVGDTIEKALDDRSRVGYFILQAATSKQLQKIAKEIEQSIEVEFV